jgi:ATP-dependent DNA ligase
MAPTLVRAPFHRPGWIYEEKVDGYRMLAYKDGARVRLVSRNGVDHTRRYPDVAAAVARLRPSTRGLDGEHPEADDAEILSRRSKISGVASTAPDRLRAEL